MRARSTGSMPKAFRFTLPWPRTIAQNVDLLKEGKLPVLTLQHSCAGHQKAEAAAITKDGKARNGKMEK